MSQALLDILSYVSLTKALVERKSGIPNPWDPEFFKRNSQPVVANVFRSTVTYGSRRLAKQVRYGAPGIRRIKSKLGSQDVVLIHTKGEDMFDPVLLNQLRSMDDYTRDQGETELARQVADAKVEVDNLVVATLTKLMESGVAYFDNDGNLLATSSGATDTVSWQVPANNQNQLNGGVTIPWSNAAAPIPTDVIRLKARAKKESGFELANVYYGLNGPRWLTQNTALRDFLIRYEPTQAEYLKTGEIPGKMLGLNWIPAYGVQFENDAAATTDLFDDDAFTFTPKLGDWYDFMEGTYPVPTKIGIETDPVELLKSFKEVAGMFAFAQVTGDPAIKFHFGSTFLPFAKNGRAIYQLDSVF